MKRLIVVITVVLLAAVNLPVVWAQVKPKLTEMTFLNASGQVITCTSGGLVAVELQFDKPMSNTVNPVVKYGLNQSYSLNLPLNGRWENSTLWQGSFIVSKSVPSDADGDYIFLIFAAKDTAGVVMDSTSSLNIQGKRVVLSIYRQGKLTSSVDTLKFGTLTTDASKDLFFVLKNVSCADLSVTRPTSSAPFSILNEPLSYTLKKGDTLRLDVRFRAMERGNYLRKLRIDFSSGGQADSVIVWLRGTARGPRIVLDPSAEINFGTVVVGSIGSKSIKVSNPAAAGLDDSLRVTNITTTLPAIFQVASQKFVLAPGDTKRVTVTFNPPAKQPYSGRLDFATNDKTYPGGIRSLALSGSGNENQPPPRIDTLIVTWPGGRVGYTNADSLTICLTVDPTDLKAARWKFTQLANNPPISAVDTTGSGLIYVEENRACFKIRLRGVLTTGRWYGYIWLEGKNGASGYGNAYATVLNYDTTPPSYSTSPRVTNGWTGGYAGYTNAENLTLCWQASDPSGIVEVRWKFSTKKEPPRDAFDYGEGGGTIRQEGITCATLPLKGRLTANKRWYCYLWLVDGSGNANWNNAAATETTVNYDLTTPAKPTLVARNIPVNEWFGANRTLTLTLKLQTEARDAAKVRWKFKQPPVPGSLHDGESSLTRTKVDTANFSVLFNSPALCGDDTLYFWFADSAGNTNPANYSLARYKFDMCPPVVNSILVRWPSGSKPGYTSADRLTICVALDTSRIKEARWKFTERDNDKPTSAIDTTRFGGTGKLTSFKKDSACFTIPLLGRLSAGRWYCYVWLEGKSGVSGYANAYLSVINYDVTPPAFKSPPQVTQGWTGGFPKYTNADNLTVCWVNESDLSGVAEVRWKFTTTKLDTPRSASDTTSFGGSLRKDGITCATLPLKRKLTPNKWWYCYLWLVDGTGNSNYKNARATEINVKYDLIAPATSGEPVDRNIEETNWFSANRRLTLTLDLPPGARDAAKARWKFKTLPDSTTQADDDTNLVRGTNNSVSFSIFFNSPNLCGDDTLYYWLADSAGNANPQTYSFARYRFDMCPPEIKRASTGEAVATKHTAFADTIRIVDHNPVQWDSVIYRFGGAMANEPSRRLKPAGSQPIADNKTQFTFVLDIPADGVTTRGIEYKIFAKDTLRNLGLGPQATGFESACRYEDDNNWQPVRVRLTGDGEHRSDKDGKAIPLPYGREYTNYTLFSVPFELDNGTPKAVLEDDLGTYDKTKWRFFEYRTELGANAWIEYNSASPTIAPFKPGRAFFLIVADPDKIIDSGIGKTVSTAKRFAIELKKGWNLFGNPFNFPISRDLLRLVNSSIPQDSTIAPSLHSYERRWNLDDIIEPWKGYAVYVEPRKPNEKIQLLICPLATSARVGKARSPMMAEAGEWTLQIAATVGAAADTINWIGARRNAAEEYDDFDMIEPPVIGDYVSVYVRNEHWSQHPMKYTADFRPLDADGYEWPLVVTTNRPDDEVVLEFSGLATLPSGYGAYLVDRQYGMAHNLRRDSQYRIRTGAYGLEKSFGLLVGKTETLQKLSGDIALIPKAFELAPNFPNPFQAGAVNRQAFTAIRYALPKSAVVTLEVFNLLGQRIRTLVAQQAQAADYYLVTWDGRDELGKEVSSGIYVYRLLADSNGEKFTATRKLTFVK